MRNARNAGVGLVVASLVLFGASPAQADDRQDDWEAVSAGHLGSTEVTVDGDELSIDPLAECDSEGQTTAQSSTTEIDDIVQFTRGRTTCVRNESTGVASAKVVGGRFRLEALRPYGGPLVRLSSYKATCNTIENGSRASIEFGGLTGVAIPQTLPPNHTVKIRKNGRLLAKIVFNEKIVPRPADGSLTVNVMRIVLFPRGPASAPSGEIVVGSVSCSPF